MYNFMFVDPNKEVKQFRALVLSALVAAGGMTVAEAKKLFNYVLELPEGTYSFVNATKTANETAEFFGGQLVPMPVNATVESLFKCANGAVVSSVSAAKSALVGLPSPDLPVDFADRLADFVCGYPKWEVPATLVVFAVFVMAAVSFYLYSVLNSRCAQKSSPSLKNDLAATKSYGTGNTSSFDVEQGLDTSEVEGAEEGKSVAMKPMR